MVHSCNAHRAIRPTRARKRRRRSGRPPGTSNLSLYLFFFFRVLPCTLKGRTVPWANAFILRLLSPALLCVSASLAKRAVNTGSINLSLYSFFRVLPCTLKGRTVPWANAFILPSPFSLPPFSLPPASRLPSPFSLPPFSLPPFLPSSRLPPPLQQTGR